MTAKIKIIIIKTTVRLDKAGKVLAMMVKISFRDFQDLANLNTRRSLKGEKCKVIIKIGAIIDPVHNELKHEKIPISKVCLGGCTIT